MSDSEFEGLPVIDTKTSPQAPRVRRKSRLPIYLGLGALGVALACALVWMELNRGPETHPTLVPVRDCTVAEGDPLEFKALANDVPPEQRGVLRFSLAEAPEDATLDAKTGEFSWTPSEQDGGAKFPVRLQLFDPESESPIDQCSFTVHVRERNEKPVLDEIPKREARPGDTVRLTVKARDPDDPPRELEYLLVGRNPRGVKLDRTTGELEWAVPDGIDSGDVSIGVGVREIGPKPASAKTLLTVHVTAGKPQPPVVTAAAPAPEAETEATPEPVQAAVVEDRPQPKESPEELAATAEDETLLAHFEENDYFLPKQYPVFRKIYSDRFERENRAVLDAGYGSSAEAVAEVFEKTPALKEEFYTALDPERDRIGAAAEIFGKLVAEFPKAFPAYGELAIATAVVWDEKRAPYSYEGHQRRTKSSLPDGRLDAIGNFCYWLDAQSIMQGRGRFLPWEFLVHTVNHRTPLPERKWAVDNYLAKRVMIGKCYGDVPYDTEMLETGSKVAKLNGHPYTLPNLRLYGGVCAMQADFAARVAKSLGVPAVYVGGESQSGERHAWVMWVELLDVSARQIQFELKSHGRYRGDLYYVGTLQEPVSGKTITDRQLEMRLHTVGLDRNAKRHAELIMKTWPMYEAKREMDVGKRIAFLDRVIRLCPGNEQAWHALAELASSGEIEPKHRKVVGRILDSLFVTFAAFPDFTWEIFPDFVMFEDNPQKRRRLFERAIEMYVQAKRPDLACEAVLHFADELVGREEYAAAAQGLSSTILAFPTEGRYVPKMIDRLGKIVPELRDGEKNLVGLYETLLPRVPKRRGKRPSAYCMEMIERALPKFQAAGRTDLVAMWSTELQKLKTVK